MTRQRIPASIWQEHVAQWRSNGQRADVYASAHGIGVERLKYWSRRAKHASNLPSMMPVRVGAVIPTGPLELRSPSGWTMRMDVSVDTAWLAKLLRELR